MTGNDMKRNIWYIDGEDQEFRTLDDLKNHLWALDETDRRKYTGDTIIHDIDGEDFSYLNFHYDEKKHRMTYGRIIRNK